MDRKSTRLNSSHPSISYAVSFELVMALEDEFGIEIPDEEAEKITTVQLAIDFAKSKQG